MRPIDADTLRDRFQNLAYDDLISRQAAINTVFSMCCRWNTDDPNDLKNMLMAAFQGLPSAEPERKKGKWIYVGIRGRFPACQCSECGNTENADWASMHGVDYCPNCGAEMKGEGDE